MTAPEGQQKTIGIPLFGKGVTNHLHRQEIIDEFARHGWKVTFWVRPDYMDLVERLPGCSYEKFPPFSAQNQRMKQAFDAKTVMFAGSAYDFHYFEMIASFDELKRRSKDRLQLVMRIYPNRYLLQSAYMHTILKYLEVRKDVWVSIGDPNYNRENYGEMPIKIEENELWLMLQFCDVVGNIFSTLTIEACIFDKPVINMWYFPKVARALKQPIYHSYPLTQHIRRVMASEAADLAENRTQLLDLIASALRSPAKRRTQQKNWSISSVPNWMPMLLKDWF